MSSNSLNATPSMRIEIAQLSDPGRDPKKQINEDTCDYQVTKFGYLLVLCDGMGGHQGGRQASQIAVSTIFSRITELEPTLLPASALRMSIEEAGKRVYELGGPSNNRARPGSTVVAILIHDQGAEIAHVGDSRAMMLRAGQVYPLTHDHSMVQSLVDAGLLSEEQAANHPDANKITRALGMKVHVQVEVRPQTLELFAEDILLIASDGLTDLVENRDILDLTKNLSTQEELVNSCRKLVVLANDRGGHDNITVQLAKIISKKSKISNSIRPNTLDGSVEPPKTPEPIKPTISFATNINKRVDSPTKNLPTTIYDASSVIIEVPKEAKFQNLKKTFPLSSERKYKKKEESRLSKTWSMNGPQSHNPVPHFPKIDLSATLVLPDRTASEKPFLASNASKGHALASQTLPIPTMNAVPVTSSISSHISTTKPFVVSHTSSKQFWKNKVFWIGIIFMLMIGFLGITLVLILTKG